MEHFLGKNTKYYKDAVKRLWICCCFIGVCAVSTDGKFLVTGNPGSHVFLRVPRDREELGRGLPSACQSELALLWGLLSLKGTNDPQISRPMSHCSVSKSQT